LLHFNCLSKGSRHEDEEDDDGHGQGGAQKV